MLFHPPILYLGYVGMTVPFAFAIAALITGRVGEGWLLETRRWALFAWAFLTIGILLGGWWSYAVLGWSGVWAWDPVENASLLPWLTATAYIHSVLVQERRGMLRVWNLSLLVATFALTILGTFLTRSGVLSSVHAFGDGPVGAYLLGFFGVVVVASLALIGWRGDRLRSPGTIDSPLSREAAFLANNVLFAVFAFVVLLGTLFPLLVEVLQDRQVNVGAPYFDRLTMPLGLVLLFLMAVAPVLPWRKASGELLAERLFWPAVCGVVALGVAVAVGATGWAPLVAFGLGGWAAGSALRQIVLATRRQGWRGFLGRANGGMIVHLGVIVIAVALAASNSYTRSATLALESGVPVQWGGRTFELERRARGERRAHAGAHRRCRRRRRHGARRRRSPATCQIGMPVGTPSVDSGIVNDLYVTLEPGAIRRRHDGDDPRVRQAADPVDVAGWGDHGGRHVARRLPGSPRSRRPPTRCRRPSRDSVRSAGREHEDDRSRSRSMSESRDARRVAPFVAMAVALVCAGLFFVLAGADTGETETADTPLLNRPAPDAVGEDGDGDTFDLARRKGSWVVLNFFDPECVPCVEEHPELRRVRRRSERQLGNDGAELVTVVFRDDRDGVAEFFADEGGDWPVVYDDDGSIATAFGVTLVPETWLVDPNGVVRWRTISPVTAGQLDAVIDQLSGRAA